MPLTPLHLAYPWLLKMRFRNLDFAGLSAGAVAPDLEILFFAAFGMWRESYIAHSFIGSFSITILLSAFLVWFLSKIRVQRLGICGFERLSFTPGFAFSAAIGSVTHIFADFGNHAVNPAFWPLAPVGSPVVDAYGIIAGHAMTQAASAVILLLVIRAVLNRNGKPLSLLFRKPAEALSIVTGSLSGSPARQNGK